jgi:hypothetical protein
VSEGVNDLEGEIHIFNGEVTYPERLTLVYPTHLHTLELY